MFFKIRMSFSCFFCERMIPLSQTERKGGSTMEEKLYAKVYNDIIAKIKDGVLKVGDKLPSEIELAKYYGVSRITVTRAMK